MLWAAALEAAGQPEAACLATEFALERDSKDGCRQPACGSRAAVCAVTAVSTAAQALADCSRSFAGAGAGIGASSGPTGWRGAAATLRAAGKHRRWHG
mmetsp:Transcript_83836/g.270971  ORF Transcript_83836/g.270971 Transcript_83836/m.270971 type:complete len:98 (+) Transcript_83836:166-459(+)